MRHITQTDSRHVFMLYEYGTYVLNSLKAYIYIIKYTFLGYSYLRYIQIDERSRRDDRIYYIYIKHKAYYKLM